MTRNEISRIFGKFVLGNGLNRAKDKLGRDKIGGNSPHNFEKGEKSFNEEVKLKKATDIFFFKKLLNASHSDVILALVVLVVATPPDTFLVAPFGCPVEPLVHTPEDIQS